MCVRACVRGDITLLTVEMGFLESVFEDQLLTCCCFADKDIGGTYLLINGQVQALCKQHEPVHFTAQGEDKTKVAVQLGHLCRFAKVRFPIII